MIYANKKPEKLITGLIHPARLAGTGRVIPYDNRQNDVHNFLLSHGLLN